MDGSITKYYSAGGQRIAMRAGGTTRFLLTDHLGSTAITTTSSGAWYGELRYKAWGETRAFGYDPLNRLEGVTFTRGSGTAESMTYNASTGNLATAAPELNRVVSRINSPRFTAAAPSHVHNPATPPTPAA